MPTKRTQVNQLPPMIHICKLQSSAQEHDFIPAEVTAKSGGVLLADISVFLESDSENFPTIIIMMNGDGYLIDTPTEVFADKMTKFYATI